MANAQENSEALAKLSTKIKYIVERVDAIHAHVKQTNGRVSSLENWKSYITGALGILVFLSGYILVIHDKIS